jgi:hypothetical protein
LSYIVGWLTRFRRRWRSPALNPSDDKQYADEYQQSEKELAQEGKWAIPLYEAEHCESPGLAHYLVDFDYGRAEVGANVLLEVAHHRYVGVSLYVIQVIPL